MEIIRFSDEVLAKLRKNPHIARVLKGYKIEFTPEFQEIACRKLLKGTKTMREIFQEHGVDPEVLGTHRIANFARKLREKAKRENQSEEVNAMKRRELRNNPYVLSVRNDRIKFTEEFKDLVCQELLKGGKSIHEILEYLGFDTQVLGESRIWSLATKLRKRYGVLSPKQQVATNVQTGYTASQKKQDTAKDNMDINVFNHEELIGFLKQPQVSDTDADNVSETNQETETFQKAFTEEERKTLLNNPYVANVTNNAVQFKEEFKELVYQEFVQTKKTMREILQEHGVAPEILGSKRIWNFTSRLQEKAKKLQGFGDARTHNMRHPKCKPAEEKTLTERIRVLEHELAYTRQEVEFLKKTQMVDMEARISWESKHHKK